MKRKRYSGEQIVCALRQAEAGSVVADLSLDKHILQEVLSKKV